MSIVMFIISIVKHVLTNVEREFFYEQFIHTYARWLCIQTGSQKTTRATVKKGGAT